jgi:hypothetical protein
VKAPRRHRPTRWARLRYEILRNPVYVGIVVFSAIAGILGLSASIGFIRATGRYPVHEGEVINWLFDLDTAPNTTPCDPRRASCTP